MTNSNNDRRILTHIKRCKEMIEYHSFIKSISQHQEDKDREQRTIDNAKKELEHYQAKLRYRVIHE